MDRNLSPKEAEVVDRLHQLLTAFGVDFSAWQLECLAMALAPAMPNPSRTTAEVEGVLAARTTENLHLRAEVSRLKRQDWHVRWVFEHAGRERAEAEVSRLGESLLGTLAALESANAAAEMAGERADRAERHSRVEYELLPAVTGPDERRVLGDVALERHEQDLRWGEQNHPDGTGPGMFFAGIPVVEYAELVKEDLALAAERGRATWAMILLEEVAEAFAESDPAKVRGELVQVAAVATAWVQAIDRRRERVRAAALARRRARAAHVQ